MIGTSTLRSRLLAALAVVLSCLAGVVALANRAGAGATPAGFIHPCYGPTATNDGVSAKVDTDPQQTIGNCPPVTDAQALASNWSSGTRTGIAIFSPSASFGWTFATADGTPSQFNFGNGDTNVRAVAGDWDDNGSVNIGYLRTTDWSWHLRIDDNTAIGFTFGSGTGTNVYPIAGDFDGNGMTDVGYYRATDHTWHIRLNTHSGFSIRGFTYGTGTAANLLPIAGDFNGDGHTDVGYLDRSNWTWHMRYSLSEGTSNNVFTYGGGTDHNVQPVAADFNRDGHVDVGYLRPSDGTWHERFALTTGQSHQIVQFYATCTSTP